jgi:3-oxoacyl-[acyl-carrier-protein] synthase-3
METSDEWIQQRTGIRQRRFSEGDTGAADLGAEAAREALAAANLQANDLDCIIFATLSPDVDMPASACLLQELIGAPGIAAFDVRNQCSGFLYSLSVADKFIKTGTYEHVLVVGAEVHSTGLDLSTRGREVAVIFGDGAGAVVLGPESDARRGILATRLHADGRFAEKLWLEYAASRSRPRLTEEVISGDEARLFPKMEGRYVFRHAVTRMPEVIREALEAQGLSPQDISLFIPHQANLRISQAAAMSLELDEDRVYNNIQHYGNTTAGSIPIALYECIQSGRVLEGHLVCLAAFGAGFTWASALIRW